MTDDAKKSGQEKLDAVRRLLAGVPERAAPATPNSRWVVRDNKKTDPDSLY